MCWGPPTGGQGSPSDADPLGPGVTVGPGTPVPDAAAAPPEKSFVTRHVSTAFISQRLPAAVTLTQAPLFSISVSAHPWKLHLVKLWILSRWKQAVPSNTCPPLPLPPPCT